MKLLIRLILNFCFVTIIAISAQAVTTDERLDDPVLEAQARDISKNLRCMVCQNQSIDDSNAELAKDLRLLVRERLVAGDSSEEVIDYVTNIYGEYVLLKPRMGMHTILLWISPLLLLVLAGLTALRVFKSQSSSVEIDIKTSALNLKQQSALDRLRDYQD